jgi:elongation factor Ts
MLAVKSALEEADGDEEKAIEILKKRGEAQAVKKAGREQAEGGIFIASDGKRAAIVHLAAETDFVARGDDFRKAGDGLSKMALEKGTDAVKKHCEAFIPELVNKLGENVSLADVKVVEGATLGHYVHSNGKIGVIIALDGGDETKAKDAAMHAAAMAPEVVSPDEISANAVEKEKEIWQEQLKKEGKPENIWDKIMIGKEKKFREENALLKQAFVKDPGMTVEKYLDGAKITGYVRLAV